MKKLVEPNLKQLSSTVETVETIELTSWNIWVEQLKMLSWNKFSIWKKKCFWFEKKLSSKLTKTCGTKPKTVKLNSWNSRNSLVLTAEKVEFNSWKKVEFKVWKGSIEQNYRAMHYVVWLCLWIVIIVIAQSFDSDIIFPSYYFIL